MELHPIREATMFRASPFATIRSVGALLATVLISSGCLNYATFQTPDTVPKDSTRLGVGGTYTQYDTDALPDPQGGFRRVPAIAVWARKGVTDDLAVHGFIWGPLGTRVGAKYQLVGGHDTRGFGLSTGVDLEYIRVVSDPLETESFGTNYYSAQVPLYTGYEFTDAAQFYVVPRYVFRLGVPEENDVRGRAMHTSAGTVGVGLGTDVTFYLEGTFAYNYTREEPVLNGGVGVDFSF